MGELVLNGNFIRYEDFEFSVGFRITRQKHSALKNTYERAYKKWCGCIAEVVSIESFFRKIKKGSKHFRKVLEFKADGGAKIDQSRTVKKFCQITDSSFGTVSRTKNVMRQWNIYSFPNRFKVFIFKF